MDKKEVPFYDEGYRPTVIPMIKSDVNIKNPVDIYNHLLSRVYKQDNYCRDAAMILYDHLCGITSRNIVCGPPGCGKTYVWDCLKEIFPRILVIDASNISKEGWSGGNKVTDFICQIEPGHRDYIIVFDEFDKCAAPLYSRTENVSAAIQSEFLKLVEGKSVKSRVRNEDIMVDTSAMTFVFCGSFAQKADEIAEKESSSGLGFGSEKKSVVSFGKELTINDLIDFGVIKELASRCTRLINIRPLSLDDYVYLVSKYEGSPIKTLEEKYGMELIISDEEKIKIAQSAYESGLGIRNVTAQIQRIMDNMIFEQFLNNEEVHNVL